MPTTNFNKKGLVLKRWEPVAAAPTATVAGSCVAMANVGTQRSLYIASTANAWLYTPDQDGWVQVPSAGLAGTFGSGTTITAGHYSIGSSTGLQFLTATGGTTSTIVTNQTLARDLRGYRIHIMGGPNAGVTLPIVRNTLGANATITVDTQASAFTASTTYRLLTPVWYVVNAGTLASASFRKFDFATNTWVTLLQTNLPTTVQNDSALTTTPSFFGTDYVSFATGTATAGGASTLTNSAKTWTTNQWSNYQIRITGGTGAGQIRTIASNTGTVITVGSAWATQPDVTSTYSIEGNDDFIYYQGSSVVTLVRYSISSNTWTVLSPTAARAAAPNQGTCGIWAYEATEADWTNESNIINGRRIYSFRGAASTAIDYYDIALNTWVSATTYAPATDTFTVGTKYAYVGNNIYLQKDATMRWFRFNVTTNEMDGWTTLNNTSGSAIMGNTAYIYRYVDGTTVIPFVYFLINTSVLHERQMIF
jgi:hypothetical protein